MCGIAGAWGTADDALVPAMTTALAHRGPDDSGLHTRGRVRLGARRLSIVDIAGGAQPFYNETGRICVVANGEIYNHDELRAHLVARGHRFTSRCDTEVIVHLYEEYGDDCVDHLQGMFAFALADGDRLLLARDRLGIKPLFYRTTGGVVLFASEIKALLRHPGPRPAVDVQALIDSFAIGLPAGERTFVEGVRSLSPGHTMVVTPGPAGPVTTTNRYYRVPTGPGDPIGFDAAQDALLDRLRETVRSHLAADVEVGLMLSGGLDSTVVAMLAREVSDRPLRTFSVADSAGHPDLLQAGWIAESIGTAHQGIVMSFDDYLAAVPAYTHAQERPGRLGGVSLHALYTLAGSQLKACLIGEGADELFGGYPEYIEPRLRAGSVQSRLHALAARGVSPSPAALEVAELYLGRVPHGDYLDRLFAWNLAEPLVQDHLELHDKVGMAASLELRVPFLDHRFVEFVAGLPVEYKVNAKFGIQKHVLKRAALRAWGADGPLADSVLRRKIGGPSAGARHHATLTDLCERELPDDYLARHDLGFCFTSKRDLLMFELFEEMFVAGRGADPADFPLTEFLRERTGRAAATIPAAAGVTG
jgi:asparagine synthase (glutamine-hydrolysing)